ncbi:MAG: cyclic nucleotide-binding domain-containing protein [Anaerolineae bacterium]|nr:cyclic nucleotide-binding domain-containing protein [Candidatus Roseilinea sp.]MDW8450312.1 cyclic nucleotide-binding domain-containing protein [Anaerolineae bacterium]
MAQEAGSATNGQAPGPNSKATQAIPTPDDIVRRLRESTLFSRLTDAEFKAVLGLMRTRMVNEGQILVLAGAGDTNLYILRRGKMLIRAPEKGGRDPIIRFVQPGEILNELPFVTGHPSEVTIETVTPVQLWYIPRGEFQQLLQREGYIREHLTYTPEEEKYIKQRRRFDTQRPGELVLWFGRKHWWVLLRSQWFTILLLVFVGVIFLPPLRPILSVPFGMAVVGALLFVALASFLWFLIDWWNDYYVVTDQRVIHRERILIIYDSQDEAPISSVQNVTIERPSFINTVLNAGTLLIETLGAHANIRFEWVGEPNKISKLILDQQARARVEVAAVERSKVRSELRREMEVGTKSLLAPALPAAAPQSDKGEKSPPFLRRVGIGLANLCNEILPRVRLVRAPDVIVYRKHWLALIGETIVPLLFSSLYFAMLAIVWFNNPPLRQLLFETPAVAVVALLGFILLFWLIWQYEDWRNDIYMLTTERLIEYKRTPFGLLGTSQRTASLANVQNVTSVTKGFIDNLFNVGDVAIRTGGMDNELNFVRVWNPRGVQREVVMRLEAYRAVQREREAARRRREFIEWIGIYDELTRLHGERPLG